MPRPTDASLDALEALVLGAPTSGMSSARRIDPRAFRSALDDLRRAAAPVVAEEAERPDGPVTLALHALERVADRARRVPFRDEVRISLVETITALDAIREATWRRPADDEASVSPAEATAGGELIRSAFDAIDAIDDLVFEAPQVPLTDQVRLDPAAFQQLVEALRIGASAIVSDEQRRTLRPVTEHIERLQSILDDAPSMPLGSKVRVRREQVFAVLSGLVEELPEALNRQRG